MEAAEVEKVRFLLEEAVEAVSIKTFYLILAKLVIK